MSNLTYHLSIPFKLPRVINDKFYQYVVVDCETSFTTDVLMSPKSAMQLVLQEVVDGLRSFDVSRVRFGSFTAKKGVHTHINEFVDYTSRMQFQIDLESHPWRCAIVVENSDCPMKSLIPEDYSKKSLFQTLNGTLYEWSPFS